VNALMKKPNFGFKDTKPWFQILRTRRELEPRSSSSFFFTSKLVCHVPLFAVVVRSSFVGTDDARNQSVSGRGQLGRNQLPGVWTSTLSAALLSRCTVSSTLFLGSFSCFLLVHTRTMYLQWWALTTWKVVTLQL